MADRIVAALEYLDAHTSIVLQKQKHRYLGDIDAKYDVVDPTEVALDSIVDDSLLLAGTSRTNLSRQKTIDQILDEDRKKILRTVQRTRSASTQKTNAQSRPPTSLSSASSILRREKRRKNFRRASQLTSSSASLSSTKRLIFTPPGVNIGPSDARDEVMDEIANKPLTHNINKPRTEPSKVRGSFSAPTLGRQHRVSIGCKPMTPLIQRSKTFHSQTRKSDTPQSKYERKPGPFTTVKVAGRDMWVVSNSTPSTYFNEDLIVSTDDEKTKPDTWENTANSVPREEKKSPPRYQRQLGEPPQFGPTQQWYSFSGNNPSKQRPILTAFADEANEQYYAIESRVSQKVASLLYASPGIRIGINGEVVSKSMKVKPKQGKNQDYQNDFSQSEDEEDDNKNENEKENCYEVGSQAGPDSPNDQNLTEEDEVSNADSNGASNGELITVDEKEDRNYSLLRYLGVARGENPYLIESSSETTSSGDVTSLINSLRKNGKNTNFCRSDLSENEDAIWKLLEGVSPDLWLNKQRWREMREDMAKRKAKRFAYCDEEGNNPLSWDQQLIHKDDKVIEPRNKVEKDDKDMHKNGTTPVVFRKLLNYDQLPANFVHITPNGFRPHSSVSAVDKHLNLSAPSKGFQSTVQFSHRETKSAHVRHSEVVQNENNFLPRPFSTLPSPVKSNEENSEECEVKVATMLEVASGPLKVPHATTTQTLMDQTKNDTEFIPDEVSEAELQAVREEAAYNMKMMGSEVDKSVSASSYHKEQFNLPTEERDAIQHATTDKLNIKRNSDNSVTLNSLPMKAFATIAKVEAIRPSVPRSSIPVSSLNLSEIEEGCNVVNGSNPASSDRLSSVRKFLRDQSESSRNIVLSQMRNGHSAPANSPKTPLHSSVYFHDGSGVAGGNGVQQVSWNDHKGYNERPPRSGSNRQVLRSASITSSPAASPRSNIVHINNNSNLPQQINHRPSGGFKPTLLTAKQSSNKHSVKFANDPVKSVKSNKPTSPAIIPHGNTYADVITKSGFIQISQPLQLPTRRSASAGAGKHGGNKMYDSYMRELSSKSEGGVKRNIENAISGKSLGGTSGRVLPAHLTKTIQNTVLMGSSKPKTSHPNFSSQNGRRSGLAITAEQTRAYSQLAMEDVEQDRSVLGLQGGSLRLNLDKNIHVIYRDLGIPKKSSRSSLSGTFVKDGRNAKPLSQRSDPVRSLTHSAKSNKSASIAGSAWSENDTKVVNVPTVHKSSRYISSNNENFKINLSENALENFGKANNDSDLATRPSHASAKQGTRTNVGTGEVDVVMAEIRKSSAKSRASLKSASEVTDSGTQWSPHEPLGYSAKDLQLENKVNNPEHPEPKEQPYVQANGVGKDLSDFKEGIEKTEIAQKISSQNEKEQEEKASSYSNVANAEKVELIADTAEKSEMVEEKNRDDETSLDIKHEVVEDSDNLLGSMGQRSVSESHLDQIDKDRTEQFNDENKVTDETDVRGVTKVTVNIAPTSNT